MSSSTPSEDIREINDRISRSQSSLLDVWKLYLPWYTWFISANLLMIGWVVSREPEVEMPTALRVMSFLWIFLNAAACYAIFRVGKFTKSARDPMKKLISKRDELTKLGEYPPVMFPLDLGLVAARSNLLGAFANFAFWCWYFFSSL